MASPPVPGRALSIRWMKAALTLLLSLWLFFFGLPLLSELVLNPGRADLSAVLLTFLSSWTMVAVPMAFVLPVAWAWPRCTEAFGGFDSWPIFLLLGFLLFPASALISVFLIDPFMSPTLAGGVGSVLGALGLAFLATTAYGLPRLLLPSLRPGRFREACDREWQAALAADER